MDTKVLKNRLGKTTLSEIKLTSQVTKRKKKKKRKGKKK